MKNAGEVRRMDHSQKEQEDLAGKKIKKRKTKKQKKMREP